jgi:hypothetical protein
MVHIFLTIVNTLIKIQDMVTYGHRRQGIRTDRAQLKKIKRG